MLILVESFPQPQPPSDVAEDRRRGREWLVSLVDTGHVRFLHPKPGRGMIVGFDVESIDELHVLLTEWGEYVPCTFRTTPLLEFVP